MLQVRALRRQIPVEQVPAAIFVYAAKADLLRVIPQRQIGASPGDVRVGHLGERSEIHQDPHRHMGSVHGQRYQRLRRHTGVIGGQYRVDRII